MIELSADEQAALVRDGRASARELVQESLAAIERANPELNAFVLTCPERALAEADAIAPGDPRPLAGVPIAIKDLIVLTEGLRTTNGSNALPDFVPEVDSAPVRKLREAGAIIVGKTNTPEFGMRPVTEPVRFGATRNPWDTDRIPGGSSGGSAAAVAAGMLALAHGSDAGGSIRIPASCCGCVGLKPSRFRVPLGPELAEFAGFSGEGVLSRTVLDTALALDVLAAPGPETPLGPPLPPASFADAARGVQHPLRIRVTVTPAADVDVDPTCADAAYAAADLLAHLGHEVDEWTPDWADPGFQRNWETAGAYMFQRLVKRFGELAGHELDPELMEPGTRGAVTAPIPQEIARQAADGLAGYARTVIASWYPGSLLLTPTMAILPGPVGGVAPELGVRHSVFTRPFNITGQPAISLPLHRTAAGIPIGVQLAGPVGSEARLLGVAGQLEQAAPWPLTAAVRAG
jgi:amidase